MFSLWGSLVVINKMFKQMPFNSISIYIKMKSFQQGGHFF